VLVQRFDLEGVSVSHGSACASGSQLPSPVLLAIGAGEERARCAVRLSVGPANSAEQIAAFRDRAERVLAAVMPRATC
jgi:cysteine desulfurase